VFTIQTYGPNSWAVMGEWLGEVRAIKTGSLFECLAWVRHANAA
jgi:hypothetical protein